MSNPEKNASIKKSLAETKIRRQGQNVKVFEIKIDAGHLSKEKERKLELAFIQAKWIYNYCLDSEDMFSLESKKKKVPVNVLVIFKHLLKNIVFLLKNRFTDYK